MRQYFTPIFIIILAWSIYIINKSDKKEGKILKIAIAVIAFVLANNLASGSRTMSNMYGVVNIALILAFVYTISKIKKSSIKDKYLKITLGFTILVITLWIITVISYWNPNLIIMPPPLFYTNTSLEELTLEMLTLVLIVWYWYGILKIKAIPVFLRFAIGIIGLEFISFIFKLLTKSTQTTESGFKTIGIIIYIILTGIWFLGKKLHEKKVSGWLIGITCFFAFTFITTLVIQNIGLITI